MFDVTLFWDFCLMKCSVWLRATANASLFGISPVSFLAMSSPSLLSPPWSARNVPCLFFLFDLGVQIPIFEANFHSKLVLPVLAKARDMSGDAHAFGPARLRATLSSRDAPDFGVASDSPDRMCARTMLARERNWRPSAL